MELVPETTFLYWRADDMFRAIVASAFLAGFCLVASPTAVAQGFLISSEPGRHRLPRPMPRPVPGQPGFLYDIAKLEIDASIRDQVAEVQVGQTFKNRSSRVLQVKFVFPLPYDGAVDQLVLNMLSSEKLSNDELLELESLIAQARQQRKQTRKKGK